MGGMGKGTPPLLGTIEGCDWKGKGRKRHYAGQQWEWQNGRRPKECCLRGVWLSWPGVFRRLLPTQALWPGGHTSCFVGGRH